MSDFLLWHPLLFFGYFALTNIAYDMFNRDRYNGSLRCILEQTHVDHRLGDREPEQPAWVLC